MCVCAFEPGVIWMLSIYKYAKEHSIADDLFFKICINSIYIYIPFVIFQFNKTTHEIFSTFIKMSKRDNNHPSSRFAMLLIGVLFKSLEHMKIKWNALLLLRLLQLFYHHFVLFWFLLVV